VKVKISYLNSQGRDNIAEVVDMFSKDRGPLTFELLENNYSSDHFQNPIRRFTTTLQLKMWLI
jgi:hypothetical protein